MQEKLNNSPWLEQLGRTRPARPLTKDIEADIAIVGAGIAGAATAYFTLRDTTERVVVLEAGRVAHGATGHNAGQVVSYFERPLAEIIEEFGEEKALAGLADVESAWELLEQIYAETSIEAPLTQFTGYAGCTNIRQITKHLHNDTYRVKAGLPRGPVIIDEKLVSAGAIPKVYDGLYVAAPQTEILDLLETNDTKFIAALGSRKGCLNSARFTEELFTYLIKKYPERLQIFEHTPVQTVRLHKHSADIIAHPRTVVAKRVVLCTNGFEYLKIENKHGADINTEFHQMIKGAIGYMAAYKDNVNRPPTAVSYLPVEDSQQPTETVDAAPYFYLTRRPYYAGTPDQTNLICIGGPEVVIEDTNAYTRNHAFPAQALHDMDEFLRTSYRHTPKEKLDFAFLWHGLMGYTQNGIRLIGPEPHNPTLLYNLGCNGIGILPSVYGGKRISQFLRGETLPPSIFDVPQVHGS